MSKWININERLPEVDQEVIIDYHGKSRIAIFCGCTEDEYKTPMFDYDFEYNSKGRMSIEYNCSFTTEVERWRELED